MRQYLVTASEMKRYDANTIGGYRMPSLLLMERAALVTVEEIHRAWGWKPCRVLVAAGCGNNGGDGLAAGRLLMLEGYDVACVLLGSEENCTEETRRQLEILREYRARIFSTMPEGEYDIVIDALFGIGLSRPLEGVRLDAVGRINRYGARVCSVDIPSGVGADTGEVMGGAVRADMTVTYGFRKLGHMLYPGAAYTGRLVCRQMGIDERSFLGEAPYWYTLIGGDGGMLPARRPDGNKGTFGKTLVIAGNGRMAGAAMLAAKSALRVGAGMVKVVTAEENRAGLQQFVPEAMSLTYPKEVSGEDGAGRAAREAFMEELRKAQAWADSMLVGPGIGTGAWARELLRFSIMESGLPLVIDADGLNLLAQDGELQAYMADGSRMKGGGEIVLTPHLGEFSRLYRCSVRQAKEHLTDYPLRLCRSFHCTVVCKDARSVVAGDGTAHGYLNTTGNAGMATAGSGDVLAGMIAGLLAQGMTGFDAAVLGAYLHGLAGDLAAKKVSEAAMTATDIIERIGDVFLLLQDKGQRGVEKRI